LPPIPKRPGSRLCLALAAALVTLGACATVPPPVAGPPADAGLPRRVAVLPFVNRTPNPEAAVVLRRMFYNFFSSLAYADVEPGVVDASLEASGLMADVVAGRLPALERLGRLLDADALIVGEALSLGQTFAVFYANQQAGLRARLIDCRSGRVLWEAERTTTVHAGDVPLSIPGLAASLVKTAITYQQANVLGAAAELCMQMVAGIPVPPGPAAVVPSIQALVHNGAGRLLLPGDELRVVLVGDPRHKAELTVPGLVRELPMEEKEPGVYAAAYLVRPEDRTAGDGRVAATLRSPAGAARQWEDTLGGVRVGTPTPLPAAIAADTVLTAERSPYLVEEVLVVQPGATLAIEPGVAIWFTARGMVVRGRVVAQGSAEQPVVFAGLTSKGWKGIFVDGSEADNRIEGCRVSGAEYGIRAVRSRLTVDRCSLQDNGWALVAEEGRLEVSRSLVRASARTGIAARRAEVVVTESIVTENGGGGILIESATARVRASHLLNNGGWSVRAVGDAAEVDASENWWGTEAPGTTGLAPGGVRIEPALSGPVRGVGPGPLD
jgi:hypothetical protein